MPETNPNPEKRRKQSGQRSPNKPGNGRANGQLSSVQLMFAVIIAVGMMLAINFSSRIRDSQEIFDAYNQIQLDIATLEQEEADLIAERDYAQSDAYVEEWARDRGKMIRPGERLIVPVPSSNNVEPTPIPTRVVIADTGIDEPEPWELWWALFIDSPPPNLESP